MINIKKFVKNELIGWRPLEIAWLFIATVIILGLSIYWKDTLVGIISALTGIWCVILTGKGKVSNFIFGIVNVILYAVISFEAKYYGEVMLNLLYYLPCSIAGLFIWSKHLQESGEVTKRRMTLKSGVITYTLTAVGVIGYGFLLKMLGGKLPFIDSASTVLSVVAQILCLRRLAEQWVLWIIIDSITVVMWGYNFARGGESIATLLMWGVYLLNAIFMYVKWRKDVKLCDIK